MDKSMNESISSININCDLGEGIGNDADLMPLLTSCNIACGGHFGDESTMAKTIRLAAANKVQIGAHPSYPDSKNFGRYVVDMSGNKLQKSLVSQIESLRKQCDKAGEVLSHVKPHGALYNECFRNTEVAEVVLESLLQVDQNLILYAPFHSMISELAIQSGLTVKYEVFADRNYNDDLSLVSRQTQLAMVKTKDVVEHVSRMVLHQQVKTLTGMLVSIRADTVCVHSDHPEALKILKLLRSTS